MSRTFRFFNLQVHAGIVLDADDSKQGTDGFGGRALAAHNLAHIRLIYSERQKHTHLIHFSFNLNVLGVIHEGLNQVIQKFLISGIAHYISV